MLGRRLKACIWSVREPEQIRMYSNETGHSERIATIDSPRRIFREIVTPIWLRNLSPLNVIHSKRRAQ